jgi:hypothetical protein
MRRCRDKRVGVPCVGRTGDKKRGEDIRRIGAGFGGESVRAPADLRQKPDAAHSCRCRDQRLVVRPWVADRKRLNRIVRRGRIRLHVVVGTQLEQRVNVRTGDTRSVEDDAQRPAVFAEIERRSVLSTGPAKAYARDHGTENLRRLRMDGCHVRRDSRPGRRLPFRTKRSEATSAEISFARHRLAVRVHFGRA